MKLPHVGVSNAKFILYRLDDYLNKLGPDNLGNGYAGPLRGVGAGWETISYNWSDPSPLAALMARLDLQLGVVGVSSEGGLFEYAADYGVRALRTAGSQRRLAH